MLLIFALSVLAQALAITHTPHKVLAVMNGVAFLINAAKQRV